MDKADPTTTASPVVVGIDGSRRHLNIVDVAVEEAVLRRAPLVIAHVWPGRYVGALRVSGRNPTELDGRRLLDTAALRAAHHGPGLRVDTVLTGGSIADALIKLSDPAQLLVVGHRDDLPMGHGWGSTAAYLAHHNRCPLMVHRGQVHDRGPIALAASAGESADAAVRCAFEAAAARSARLVALHVLTDDAGHDEDPRAQRNRAEGVLSQALAGWIARYPDVPVERLILHDFDVAYTLERAARRCRLLVAGMGPDGRFAERLYGSVSASLLSPSACPVLLVPTGWTPAEYPAERGAGHTGM